MRNITEEIECQGAPLCPSDSGDTNGLRTGSADEYVPISPKQPRLVVCAGIPRSGTTWIYNAVLMLLRANGKAAGAYCDEIPADLGDRPDDTCIVLKCHAPSPDLIALARVADAPIVLSVRDPRDCLASLESAFNKGMPTALHQLTTSASALLKLKELPRVWTVQYEASSDRSKVIQGLAAHLGISATPELIGRIAEELSPEAVKEKIARWESEGTLDAARPSEVWTEESRWHARHCGDGASGKYADHLSDAEITAVEIQLRHFFKEFDYPLKPPPVVESGVLLDFGADAIAYATEGFSHAEGWGAWTDGSRARIVLPLKKKAERLRLEVAMVRGASVGHGNQRASAELFVNGVRAASLFDHPRAPEELLLVYNGDGGADRAEIEFRFDRLASPRALGLNEDRRLLGVGIRTLRIGY